LVKCKRKLGRRLDCSDWSNNFRFTGMRIDSAGALTEVLCNETWPVHLGLKAKCVINIKTNRSMLSESYLFN
jgi:hypothetical protein